MCIQMLMLGSSENDNTLCNLAHCSLSLIPFLDLFGRPPHFCGGLTDGTGWLAWTLCVWDIGQKERLLGSYLAF